MGLKGYNCKFSCDTGYMLQENITNGTCESTGNWNTELPSCMQLTCENRNKMIKQSGAMVLPSPSCGLSYQSNCTVSCKEGFIGDDVTYSCNVTSDPTIVDWVPIGGADVMCERGLLVIADITV